MTQVDEGTMDYNKGPSCQFMLNEPPLQNLAIDHSSCFRVTKELMFHGVA